MTTLWTKNEPADKKPDPDPEGRPTVVFEVDYDLVDETGKQLLPFFTVEFEATGEAWGADDADTYGIRTLQELIDYLKDVAASDSIFDPKELEYRPMTVMELLESWDFKPVPKPLELRIRLKEEG